MKKKVVEFTYNDLKEYGNNRACDGKWSLALAMNFMDFCRTIPQPFFNRKKKQDAYVKQHIHQLFNVEEYPNMAIDIETGDFEV